MSLIKEQEHVSSEEELRLFNVSKNIEKLQNAINDAMANLTSEEILSCLTEEQKKVFSIKDPKYLGIPNICFSLQSKNDERSKRFAEQRIKFGFDESETWSLANTIASFIIPRLKYFIKLKKSYVVLEDKNLKRLNKMLTAFELIDRNEGSWIWTKEEEEAVEKGLKIFQKYYLTLWW